MRSLRFSLAVLMTMSVLFSQLAVSAYACAGAPAMAWAAAASMESMAGCDEMPADERSALCEAHCLQGDRSLDKPAVSLQAAAFPSAYPMPMPVPASYAGAGVPQGPLGSLLDRPTEPPLAVRHCRFHI